MRIDVLDLGSNTFHLLRAEVVVGELRTLFDAKVVVRLGERSFAEGRISGAAFERGLAAIDELLAADPALRPVTVATGVFREASNAAAFVDAVRDRFGLEVTILSGQTEARLTYDGVRAEALDPDGRLGVFDLGGGSLECLVGHRGEIELADSLPLGALRLATAARGEVASMVRELAGPIVSAIRACEPDEVLLSSGTARALRRLATRLGHPEAVRGCLMRTTLRALATALAELTPAEVAALGVTPSRTDTIASGAVVLATVVELLDVPCVRIATGALREGVALEVASASASRPPRARPHAVGWQARLASS